MSIDWKFGLASLYDATERNGQANRTTALSVEGRKSGLTWLG